jgi:hypothetical protein
MGYMKMLFMDIQEYVQEHPEVVVGDSIRIEVDTFEGRKWINYIVTKNDIGISCIGCKKLCEEKDMKKIFERGEGICNECWNFDGE